MAAVNPLRDAITSGNFCYMVEMVASASMTEEKLGDIAAGIAGIPEVVGAGITSWAGGSAGHDPVRVAEIAKNRGLTPNVHLTCVSKMPADVAKFLDDLIRLDLENVFAITGDYPKGAPLGSVSYACDSVQLVETVARERAAGRWPFFISAAVSPFKYTEADCAYQYLKLEKKIAAGADFAITQLGFDSRKYVELKRYLAEKGLAKFPVLGNVYVLPPKAAERMSKGDPPGCWVSPELLARIQEEAKAADKGMAARLERAAQMAAIVRGLGYAGAYIGGTHEPDRIRFIIRRAEELAPRWQELAEEISYGDQKGFYMYQGSAPPPEKREWTQPVFDLLEPANWPGFVRAPLTGLFRWMDHHPSLAKAMEDAEFAFKQPVFGCQACGNCVLGLMEYVCPMTCPKNMRNGPCGGTFNGQCEVIPEKLCIWVKVHDRAKAAHRLDDLKTYIPPRNRSLEGSSSYINYLLDKDSRPEHPKPLISIGNLQPSRESEETLVKE